MAKIFGICSVSMGVARIVSLRPASKHRAVRGSLQNAREVSRQKTVLAAWLLLVRLLGFKFVRSRIFDSDE